MNKIHNKISENKGFVRTAITLVVILVILSLVGLDINKIWYNFLWPIFSFVGNLIYSLANWLVGLLRNAWGAVSSN